MLTLYDNPFSPFARKVRMVLRFKGLEYRSIDALALSEHERLASINPRAEVPVLVDGPVAVADSADIVAYLEDRFPEPTVLPITPELRAKARRCQRLADTVLDAIVHDISIWVWPTHHRSDPPPEGLLEEGRRELREIINDLEGTIGESGFFCDRLSIGDFSLFPHLSSLKPLGVHFDEIAHPKLMKWNRHMRAQSCVREDLEYVKRTAIEKFGSGSSPYEAEKIVWRGDRIEWLMAHGFQDWFYSELTNGRAEIPRSLSRRP
ncbi:MAG: glutathione S-transferase family protein [bacterium]|nr:glutathione S-transferase family protein [bacterium]